MTTILWYDYETFGINPKIDRPSQFAAIRTDLDLNPIGEPVVLFCKPANDFLPHPEACLITGITPQIAFERGIKEVDFFSAIRELMAEPGTVSAGYNSISFDSEVSRFGLYRNFMSAYDHEWKNDCSRWDLLDVMRAAAVYSGSNIVWPKNDEGRPSFKLTDLTTANGISHESAHDALDDVRATIALAKLLKEKRPSFYNFVFNTRTKKEAEKHLVIGAPVMHVSRSYGSDRHYTAQVLPIVSHPSNKNAVISFDLGADSFTQFIRDEAMTADDIKDRLYAKSDLLKDQCVARPPLVSIQINKCPSLIPTGAFTDKVADLFSIDKALIKENHNALIDFQKEHPEKYSMLLIKIKQSFNEPLEPETDPDLMLYSQFISNNGSLQSAKVHNTEPSELASLSKGFVVDAQLPELLFRFRARNYLETLSSDELERWNNYRFERIATYSNDYDEQLNKALDKRMNDASLSQEDKDKADQIISALRQHAIATFSPELLSAINDVTSGFSDAAGQALDVVSVQSSSNDVTEIQAVESSDSIGDEPQPNTGDIEATVKVNEKLHQLNNLTVKADKSVQMMNDFEAVAHLKDKVLHEVEATPKEQPSAITQADFQETDDKTAAKMISLVSADSKDKKYQLLYVNHDLITFKGAPHNRHQDSLNDYALKLSQVLTYRYSEIDLCKEGIINAAEIYPNEDIRHYADGAVLEIIKSAPPAQTNIFGDRMAMITGISNTGPARAIILNNHIMFNDKNLADPTHIQAEQSAERLAKALEIDFRDIHLDLPDSSSSELFQQAWSNMGESDVEPEIEISEEESMRFSA